MVAAFYPLNSSVDHQAAAQNQVNGLFGATDGSHFYVVVEGADAAGNENQSVALFLVTGEDQSVFYQILADRAGGVSEYQYAQGGFVKSNVWRSGAQVEVLDTEQGWRMVIAIPLANLDWEKVERWEQEVWANSIVEGNIAHHSLGTTVKPLQKNGRSPMTTLIDGLKEKRSSGWEQYNFEPGNGVELQFKQPKKPARMAVYYSNVSKARVLAELPQGWQEVGRATWTGEDVLEIKLSGVETQNCG